MKLHFLDRTNSQQNSFSITRNRHPHFLKVWHYHPELELVIILESTGTRFIGDNIEPVAVGDVVLIGANLPHMWMNDGIKLDGIDDEHYADAISVHFREDFLGDHFFNSFELKPVKDLLLRSELGICFRRLPKRFINKFISLSENKNRSPLMKTIILLDLLAQLSEHKNYQILSTAGFKKSFEKEENSNLKKIYEFIYENFRNPISSSDVAEVVNMNNAAFSRFFKRIHRTTFTNYLNEIRVGYACKLLIENKLRITYICYDSVFNNISNFNRQFKLVKNMTPSQYTKKFGVKY